MIFNTEKMEFKQSDNLDNSVISKELKKFSLQ